MKIETILFEIVSDIGRRLDAGHVIVGGTLDGCEHIGNAYTNGKTIETKAIYQCCKCGQGNLEISGLKWVYDITAGELLYGETPILIRPRTSVQHVPIILAKLG